MKAVAPLTALVAAALLAACATPPPPPAPRVARSYVMLLDNADGSTGKVHVTGAGGLTVLDTARSATGIGGPAGRIFEPGEEALSGDFAAALAASPSPPLTFRLYFEFGGSRLTPLSRAELPRIVQELAKRPAPDLSIVGHTDTMGDAAGNLALGLARARSVLDMLGAGTPIPADRMSIESHGEKNLLVATGDRVDEPRNRRVEVTVR